MKNSALGEQRFITANASHTSAGLLTKVSFTRLESGRGAIHRGDRDRLSSSLAELPCRRGVRAVIPASNQGQCVRSSLPMHPAPRSCRHGASNPQRAIRGSDHVAAASLASFRGVWRLRLAASGPGCCSLVSIGSWLTVGTPLCPALHCALRTITCSVSACSLEENLFATAHARTTPLQTCICSPCSSTSTLRVRTSSSTIVAPA